LRFVRTYSYRSFAIYRIALAILVVAVAFARG
jgi:undecaprenyl pyrophosphate phosphatase UppP